MTIDENLMRAIQANVWYYVAFLALLLIIRWGLGWIIKDSRTNGSASEEQAKWARKALSKILWIAFAMATVIFILAVSISMDTLPRDGGSLDTILPISSK